jgi:uncharacterized RDD family membrane protein YckC
MNYQYPNLFKRLIAIIYDLLLLFAVLFFAAIPPVVLIEDVASHYLFSIYLYLITFFFYGWFWTHGGQTLGLRAWRLKVISKNEERVTWKQALIRYLAACLSWILFGTGFLWALFDGQKQTLHDHASKTQLIRLPK